MGILITKSMRVATFVAAAVVTGSVNIACGPESVDEVPDDAPERYAEAMCLTYARCGCMGEVFDTDEACRTESAATFRRVKEWPGVEFDDSCFEDVLEFIEASDCAAPPNAEAFPCEVFFGTLPRGEKCEAEWSFQGSVGGLSAGSCTSDGVCSGGTCVSPPGIVADVGQPCRLELGVTCKQNSYCASDGTCREQVDVGSACDSPLACADLNQYCAGLSAAGDEEGLCVNRLAVGDSCTPAEVQSCAPGYIAYCTAAGMCAPGWPSICQAATPAPDAYDARDWVPF